MGIRKSSGLWVALCLGFVAGCGGGGAGGSGPGAKEPGETTDDPAGEPAQAKPGKAPAAGTKALEKRTAQLTFDLTLKKGDAAGGMQAGSWSLEEERALEVLASEGSAVQKLRVVFGKRESKPLLGVELTAATAGHTYELESKGGDVNITRADGKELSGAERDALMAEYDWVGGPSPLAKWLGADGLAEGKKLEGGSAETRALVGVLAGVDYGSSKVSVTSKGKSGDVLSLDATATLTLVGGKTRFELTLSGPAKVDMKTGWVSALALKGPAKASGTLDHKKGTLDVTGTGKAELTRNAE
ncbi:MAG: hypothetical protein IPM35_12055 [Myxococcales bacterium]|nr:hypothetical protein [Myxococcales bacterium]